MPISLFTPLIFQTIPQRTLPLQEKMLNHITEYFLLCKAKAFLIDLPVHTEKPFQRTGSFQSFSPSSPIFLTAVKILSYITLIIPLIIFIMKCILCCPYRFVKTEQAREKTPSEKPSIYTPSQKDKASPTKEDPYTEITTPIEKPTKMLPPKPTSPKKYPIDSFLKDVTPDVDLRFPKHYDQEAYKKYRIQATVKHPLKISVHKPDIQELFPDKPTSPEDTFLLWQIPSLKEDDNRIVPSPASSPLLSKGYDLPPVDYLETPLSRDSSPDLPQPPLPKDIDLLSLPKPLPADHKPITSIPKLPSLPKDVTPKKRVIEEQLYHSDLPDLKIVQSQNPLDLDEKTLLSLLKTYSLTISRQEAHSDVTYISTSGSHLCFKLKNVPGCVFKCYKGPSLAFHLRSLDSLKEGYRTTMTRYLHTQKINEVLSKTSRIHIPIQRLLQYQFSTTVPPLCYIVEEELPLYPSCYIPLIWRLKKTELQNGALELAKIIQQGLLSHVDFKNFSPFYQNERWWIAVLKGKSLTHSQQSLTQDLETLLNGLHSEEAISIIVQQAPQNCKKAIEKKSTQCLHNLEALQSHEYFHMESHTSPYKPTQLQVLPKKLSSCLNLKNTYEGHFEKALLNGSSIKKLSVKQFTELMITEINSLLKANGEYHPTPYAHCVIFDPTNPLSFDPCFSQAESKKVTKSKETSSQFPELWIHAVLTALQKGNYIDAWEIVTPIKQPLWTNQIKIWI